MLTRKIVMETKWETLVTAVHIFPTLIRSEIFLSPTRVVSRLEWQKHKPSSKRVIISQCTHIHINTIYQWQFHPMILVLYLLGYGVDTVRGKLFLASNTNVVKVHTNCISCHLTQLDVDNDLIGDPCDTNKDRYYMTSHNDDDKYILHFHLHQTKVCTC